MENLKGLTVVLGASLKVERFSNLAVRSLVQHGYPVAAIGLRTGKIDNVDIQTGQPPIQDVDTVSIYLSAINQRAIQDYVLSLHPRRIIFNPGAENPELEKLAVDAGIETLEACTLVLLSTEQF